MKKNLKKLTALLLVLTLTFIMTSCFFDKGETDEEEDSIGFIDKIESILKDTGIIDDEGEDLDFDFEEVDEYKNTETVNTELTDFTPVSRADYYCYGKLNEKQKAAYDKICLLAESYSSETVLLSGCDFNDLATVVMAVKNDNPQYFWLSNLYAFRETPQGYRFSFGDGKGKSLYLTKDSADRNEKAKALNIAVDNAVLSVVKKGMSQFETELALHDYICNSVEYNSNYDTSQMSFDFTSYGAGIEGNAVCEGYAKFFQMLCYRVGINATVVTGKSNDTPHMWNAVQIDGSWYHVDATSDDSDAGRLTCIHDYFNMDDTTVNNRYNVYINVKSASKNALDVGDFNIFDEPCTSNINNYYVAMNTLVGNDFENVVLNALYKDFKTRNSGYASVEFCYLDKTADNAAVKADCVRYDILEKMNRATNSVTKIKYITYKTEKNFIIEVS